MVKVVDGYVIKLTGSLFEEENHGNLTSIAKTIRENIGRARFILVCGGGKTLRSWIRLLRRESEASEYDLDNLGIRFTRLNATIMIHLLKPYSHSKIPLSIDEAIYLAKNTGKIIVSGGFSPGFSTNAVSAFIAKELRYNLINITSAGGVYDKDPRKYKDAKKLDEISIDDLIKILHRDKEEAGNYPLFDLTSLNIIKKYRVPTYVIPPNHIELNKILSKQPAGTKIIFNSRKTQKI